MIKIDGREFKVNKYPNGELLFENLKNTEITSGSLIVLTYESDSDLIALMCLKGYIDDRIGLKNNCFLVIEYMPYSRMDRDESGNIFSLKYVSNFIKNLGFKLIMVNEPHSDVTPALLGAGTFTNIPKLVARAIQSDDIDINNDLIYFPDKTARERYGELGQMFKYQAVGIKKRDFETGKITGLDIEGNFPENKNYNVLMVDDLCSKGGTFKFGAEKLKQDFGAGHCYLVVAHLEDSIKEGSLLTTDLIEKIYCDKTMIRTVSSDKIISLA